MLVNMNDVLKPAQQGKYAVGLFNAVNLELARGIISAAEQTHSPVIMGTAEIAYLIPALAVTAIISGALVGIAGNLLIKKVKKI